MEEFWEDLEETLSEIPTKNVIILLGDFNAQLGKERKYRNIIGNYPAHNRTNSNGERLVEIYKTLDLIMKSTAFK